jgi:hypothetical protein
LLHPLVLLPIVLSKIDLLMHGRFLYGAPCMANKSPQKHSRANRFFTANGLTFVMFSFFMLTWLSQVFAGWHAWNDERQDHHLNELSLSQYFHSGHLWEATMENWEGEFLPMAAFVWFTACFYQKGSPESKEPYKKDSDGPVTKNSPWPVRVGGFVNTIYENSLTLTFLILFAICFFLHAKSGACAYSDEQRAHGQSAVTMWQYMGTSLFWFQSCQNWQSEFMSNGIMVVLAIYLRQKGSPESKKVASPHSANE